MAKLVLFIYINYKGNTLKTFLNVFKKIEYGIRVIFIRTVKFNLGINGTIEDEDSSWDDEPYGVFSAIFGNIFLGAALGYLFFSEPTPWWGGAGMGAILSIPVTIIIGKVLLFARMVFGIKFPLGDHFYYPTEILGKKYERTG